MDLRGRTVLVTGATGGLGSAIARALAGRGASVIVTGRRADALAPLAAETGGRALACDLADPADVERLLDEAGDVDVLVANAGLPGSGHISTFSDEEIDRALAVNLRAPMVMARRLAEPMAARGGGHIVFVSSLSGKVAERRRLGLLGDEVRPARLRAGAARGSARQRRRRLGRAPGLHPRQRHVPRLRGEAAARSSARRRPRTSRPRCCGRSSATAPRSTSRRWACASGPRSPRLAPSLGPAAAPARRPTSPRDGPRRASAPTRAPLTRRASSPRG